MIKIENKKYMVEINELGAEITHFINKETNQDLIWNDPDGTIWKRHAPLLFPAIGGSNEDKYFIKDKCYSMKQHGFARDYPFDEIHKYGDTKVVLQQHATSKTKENFPFNYVIQVTYELTQIGLKAEFTIENVDFYSMPFAFGFHPGWNIADDLSNYELTLVGNDTPIAYYGIDPAPLRNGNIDILDGAQGQTIPLSYSFLDDGLVILDAHGVKYAVLKRKNGEKILKLNIADFPYLTLWSPEKKCAPFICIEPFAGLPDKAGKPVDWYKKLGNTILPAGSHKDFNLVIEPN
ncbi:aldose 1-epimerase family protein [Lactobacillus sp. ESL0791]|uniref:aldose epimerase family protein n=1 Tax=Lactobacillus sp. ESL0791 TaxID=2983234 RepID=UPI0023F7BDA4|nr:aldose 1-epimerase family protein [Lactobacillus sp. ESL0791]MDF7638096.1 aldose 1-epimerase family protein [Lactobacillus sp. ESL0791]